MNQNQADVVEWHIFENASNQSSSATPRQAVHIGPFATEQECRTVLASLKGIPGFNQGALEVHKQAARREKRIRIKLPIRISLLTSTDQTWAADTVDVSSRGARLADSSECLKLGEFLGIRQGQRQAVFRVVWVGMPGTANAGQVGVECLSPETNIWDLDFSTRTDDEPLMQEIVIARAVQRRLFPREKPALRTLDYSGKCVQAGTVGGDYYDFLDMGTGRVGFVLADVAGKGVSAALLMANLQGSIHNRAGMDDGDLPGLLASVNRHLYQHTEADRYATLFFGCYDDEARSMAYVNCGHNPPLLLRQSGAVERLGATATVLGLFADWKGSVEQSHIDPGDLLTIFTDGITETTARSGDEFGESRLLAALEGSRELESAAIVGNIEQAVAQFRSSERLQDDLTLVIARAY
jgi:hypothetical protein